MVPGLAAMSPRRLAHGTYRAGGAAQPGDCFQALLRRIQTAPLWPKSRERLRLPVGEDESFDTALSESCPVHSLDY